MPTRAQPRASTHEDEPSLGSAGAPPDQDRPAIEPEDALHGEGDSGAAADPSTRERGLELPLPEMPLVQDAQGEANELGPERDRQSRQGDPEGPSGELFGHFGLELRWFPRSPAWPDQDYQYNTSLAFQPGYALELSDRTILRGIGFMRLDQHDNERTHFDVREALLQTRTGALTLTLGVNKVFWGVTESRHLVDIVNQTDFLEDFSGEEKLGQLMAMASYETEAIGSLELISTTWFRPRRYPSPRGRPGVPLPLLEPVYESRLERYHPDLALRWAHAIGSLDWALSYFYGTSREPQLVPVVSIGVAVPFLPFIEIGLEPYYALIHQGGLELQWTRGAWLYKLEGLIRSGQGPAFGACTLGFEYTFAAVFASDIDLGVLVEYNYDGRDNSTLNIYDNDMFGGVRVAANDEAGTELRSGALTDLKSGATSAFLEASRRFGSWKLLLLGQLFVSNDDTDPLYWFRRDDYAQATVEYHF